MRGRGRVGRSLGRTPRGTSHAVAHARPRAGAGCTLPAAAETGRRGAGAGARQTVETAEAAVLGDVTRAARNAAAAPRAAGRCWRSRTDAHSRPLLPARGRGQARRPPRLVASVSSLPAVTQRRRGRPGERSGAASARAPTKRRDVERGESERAEMLCVGCHRTTLRATRHRRKASHACRTRRGEAAPRERRCRCLQPAAKGARGCEHWRRPAARRPAARRASRAAPPAVAAASQQPAAAGGRGSALPASPALPGLLLDLLLARETSRRVREGAIARDAGRAQRFAGEWAGAY